MYLERRQKRSQQIKAEFLVVLVYTGHREDHTLLYPLCARGCLL